MYLLSLVMFLAVLPLASIGLDHFVFRSSLPLFFLVGKWFAFWAVGIRLFLAGLRQLLQPRFTAEKIFGLTTDEPLPIVRELGIANFSMGILGILTLAKPAFLASIALLAAIFYGVAGLRHLTDPHKNLLQNAAMLTDLFASLVLIAYLVFAGLR